VAAELAADKGTTSVNAPIRAGLAVAGLVLASNSYATTVSYAATLVGGQMWQYTYDVTNTSLSVPISELTFYYDPALLSGIAVGPSQPVDWTNPIVTQSDPAFLPDLSGYGFFDTVTSGTGIGAGGDLGGFTVLVNYSGSGAPGANIFQVVDPATFTTLDQGQTQGSQSASVPEPGTLSLVLLGGLFVAARYRYIRAKCGSMEGASA
jgi:hypothetical protein